MSSIDGFATGPVSIFFIDRPYLLNILLLFRLVDSDLLLVFCFLFLPAKVILLYIYFCHSVDLVTLICPETGIW